MTNLRRNQFLLAVLFIFLISIISTAAVFPQNYAPEIGGTHLSFSTDSSYNRSANKQTDPLTVGDFFLTDDELPAGWIPDPDVYTPGAYMAVKEKLMGGDWWSVRLRNSEMTKMIHVTIGYFATEAEAIKYANPDTYIFSTDAYMETGQTFNELRQIQTQYSLSGGTPYGDGGFSGGYQHQEFQPFNVFRVGSVIFHTDGSDPSTEGIIENLLVNKARRLLNIDESEEEESSAITPSISDSPTITPTVAGNPIILKASHDGYGEATHGIKNSQRIGAIIISGQVLDQEGNGVANATVEVVSGADPAAITTNPDGSYSLALIVPGGDGNGSLSGVNFNLQLEGDLSIGKIELLQAVSGSELADSKSTAALVFPHFSSKATASADTEVALYVNGQLVQTLPFRVKNEYNATDHSRVEDAVKFFIPPSFVRAGVFEVRAVIDPDNTFAEPNEDNNEKTFSQMVSSSRGLSLIMVALSTDITGPAAQSWAGTAKNFLSNTYPVPSVRIVPHPIYSDGWLNIAMSLRDAAIVNNARVAYNEANPNSPVEYAVGVYPANAYGSGNRGLIFRNLYPQAPLVSIVFPITTAHEIGHVYLGGHEEADDNDILNGVSLPEGYVYDAATGQVRYLKANSNWINFMGDPYAGYEDSAVVVKPWVSPSAYNTILGARQSATNPQGKQVSPLHLHWSANSEFDQVLYLSGYFDNGSLQVFTPQLLNKSELNNFEGGDFTVSAQAADGTILASADFGINDEPGEYDMPNPGAFQVEVPYPPQTMWIVITKNGQEFYRLEKTANPPTVTVEQPGGGNPVTGETSIRWSAEDADSDEMTYNIYYSADEGNTWQLIGLNWSGTELPMDGAYLSGSDKALIRVVASDGLNHTSANSSPFVMPKHAPEVTILPMDPDNEPWVIGHPNLLAANAIDVEDGWMPVDAFEWTSDIDGSIGQGNTIYTTLSAGEHTITVTVTDKDGQKTSDTTVINVADLENSILDSIPVNLLYLVGGGACLLVVVLVIIGAVFFFIRRKQDSAANLPQQFQDQQGRSWYQDSNNGLWYCWIGQTWQPVPGPGPGFSAPQPQVMPSENSPRKRSCLLTLISGVIIGVLVIGAISLLAFNILPGYSITRGPGDINKILTMGGGGLLAAGLGLFLLFGGFKTIITRHVIVQDDYGHRHEKRGCGAILTGFGQLAIAVLCLAGGVGLVTLMVFQEILPFLGF